MYKVKKSFICRGCSNPVISTNHTSVDVGASVVLCLLYAGVCSPCSVWSVCPASAVECRLPRVSCGCPCQTESSARTAGSGRYSACTAGSAPNTQQLHGGPVKKVKVRASHTRHRALGPELIPVYRQSACTWPQVIHPAVGCHYFSARPAVTSPAAEHHCPLAGTKLYCLVTEAHRCKQLPKDVTQRCLES